MEYRIFSDAELERLLGLLDSLKSSHPDRGVPMGASLTWVRELATSGEPDMAIRDLAEWLVDVQPVLEDDRAFVVAMAEAFPAEDAILTLRKWHGSGWVRPRKRSS